MNNIERYDQVADTLRRTYETKNRAYGDSFTESIHKYGYVAALVRMQDKMNRLDQLLLKRENPNDESAVDSAMDLCNYAMMLVMELTRGRAMLDADLEARR